MLFRSEIFQVDKKESVIFDDYFIQLLKALFLLCQVKQKQALLGSNLSGIYLMTDKNVKSEGLLLSYPSDIFRGLYAFKNPSINFFFLSIDRPLWFRSLFFKSAKCPSIALVVFGIPKLILSYHVKSQGRLFLRLRYALLNLLWV